MLVYLNRGSNPRAMSGACSADIELVDKFRFFGKPEEVSFNSHTADNTLGSS